jgi:PAS domain S-box-containing protein
LPPPYRWLMGLIPAAISLAIILLLPAEHRLPYLIAYPGVVLSAWLWGVGAGIVCAASTGAAIEYLIYSLKIVKVIPLPEGSSLRLVVFICGSAVVVWLVQEISRLRERAETIELKRQLEQAAAERKLTEERERTAAEVRSRETRLQMALEGGHVGLWDNDLEHGIVRWSDEHYRILGLEPGAASPSYALMQSAIHPEDREVQAQLFRETRDAGLPFRCEYRIIWPDGSVRWVEAQAQYERNGEGKPVRMLGVMSDITQRKQAEKALLQSEKLAVAGRLATSIAHEINNPLEAVANLLYLVSRADSLPQAHEHAEMALSEVMRMARITSQTLKFHRQTEAAKLTRLSEEIDGVLGLFHGRLVELNVSIEERFEDDPELKCLVGDLRQVFANLIANAADAMKTGGRLVIRLRWSNDWRTGSRKGIRLTFADSGEGMSAKTRRRIYEPFFTTKEETGTGLGLWLTATIVERQRGDLRVWSSQLPGRSGTVFSLFLPVEDGVLGAAVAAAGREKELAESKMS